MLKEILEELKFNNKGRVKNEVTGYWKQIQDKLDKKFGVLFRFIDVNQPYHQVTILKDEGDEIADIGFRNDASGLYYTVGRAIKLKSGKITIRINKSFFNEISKKLQEVGFSKINMRKW